MVGMGFGTSAKPYLTADFVTGGGTSRIYKWTTGSDPSSATLHTNLQDNIWVGHGNLQAGDATAIASGFPTGNHTQINENGTYWNGSTQIGTSGTAPQFLSGFATTAGNAAPVISATLTATINEGDSYNLSASISDEDAGQTLTLLRALGAGSASQVAQGSSDSDPISSTASVGPFNDGEYIYTWTGNDGAGGTATSKTTTLTVLNVAPTITSLVANDTSASIAGSDTSTVGVGKTWTLSATDPYDTPFYEWDMDGDLFYEAAGATSPSFAAESEGEFTINYRAGDDATFTNGSITVTAVAAVPEPSTVVLMIAAGGAIAVFRRKWLRKA